MNQPDSQGSNRRLAIEELFGTTHWSVVLAADMSDSPDSAAALEYLCSTYGPPLYAYLRRSGCSPIEAEDLTQGFFAHFLKHQISARADPQRGRFRAFLLTCLQHYLCDAHDHRTAAKRGGKTPLPWLDGDRAEQSYLMESVDHLTPERAFEKRWATTLLERVLTRLGNEFARSGKPEFFEHLKDYVWENQAATPVREIATRFGVSESAIRVTTHRLRHRFRDLLRLEIAHTVTTFEDIDEEIRYLALVLREP